MNTVMMLIIEFIFLHSFYWISTTDIFRLDIKIAVEKVTSFYDLNMELEFTNPHNGLNWHVQDIWLSWTSEEGKT